MHTKRTISPEYIVYICLWTVLFVMPVAILYLRAKADAMMEFRWEEVLHIWQWFFLFLICFAIHDLFMAPLLLKKHIRAYLAAEIILLIAFTIASGFLRDPGPIEHRPMRFEKEDLKKDMRDFKRYRQHSNRPFGDRFFRPEVPINILILVGLLGLNFGVKLYFKTAKDRENLQQLEKERMYLQLQYLKFQINPHFFMNTLNNIQVLIDMDAEKAKASLRELSVMMRFVLYEGDKNWVSVKKDIEFLRNYVKLMQLRYTDQLTVTIDIPDDIPDISIPPLIFPTFVENAFKHGVSYKHDTFVTIMLDVEDGMLIFGCINSKPRENNRQNMPTQGGVGLANVKRRLDLIYGDSYSLDIKDNDDVYNVVLRLPIKKKNNTLNAV